MNVDGNDDESEKLTSQNYWQKVRSSTTSPKGLSILDEIAEFIPKIKGAKFFEIGCAPGGILRDVCSRLNCEANGIDFAQSPERIEQYLQSEGVRVGHIFNDDFMNWQPDEQYDIVGSFGFVEHFLNADVAVDRHFSMTKKGGFVIIEIPNFNKGQLVLHWLFDRVNLQRHNTRIMNRKFFIDAARRNQAEIVTVRYAGGSYRFWRDEEETISWFNRRLLWRIDAILSKALAKKGVNSWFSPYIFAVYRVV